MALEEFASVDELEATLEECGFEKDDVWRNKEGATVAIGNNWINTCAHGIPRSFMRSAGGLARCITYVKGL